VYIHPDEKCLENAVKGRQIQRALEVPIPDELLAELKRVLHEQEDQ
jgi:predicted RNA-binding protein YlxR (DUF448 family)